MLYCYFRSDCPEPYATTPLIGDSIMKGGTTPRLSGITTSSSEDLLVAKTIGERRNTLADCSTLMCDHGQGEVFLKFIYFTI